MTRRRLLVLTPRFPYPPVGGDRLRIYQLCKHLSEDHDLSLLSMCESQEEMSYQLPSDGVYKHVERVLHSKARRLLGCLRVLPSRTPLQIGYYRNPEFTQRLKALLPSYDSVLAHLIRTGDYVRNYPGTKVLEMTDAISLAYTRTRTAGLSNPLRLLAYRIEEGRLLNYERSIVNVFDLTLVVSPVDRDFLAAGTASCEKMLVCANGVDTQALKLNYSPDGRTIVFIGNNTAYHNIDALLFFADQVFPRIRSIHPAAIFKIVGSLHPRLQAKLARRTGIVTTGRVANIADAVRNASVGVCPIRFGAGIQNKLLEYMALGIPAVTSAIGLEGIEATPGIHLLVASNIEEWSDQVSNLLLNQNLGAAMVPAARAFVEQHHSWSSTLQPLKEALRGSETGPPDSRHNPFQADDSSRA